MESALAWIRPVMAWLGAGTACCAAVWLVNPQLAAGSNPAAAGDPRQAMIEVLGADGPHPALGDEAAIFDRLVGSWDAEFSIIAEDGAVTRFPGELHFGWVLDGHAMQDIWISYSQDEAGTRKNIGTSVRIFDRESGQWQVVWVAASRGSLTTLCGGAEGDRIVLVGNDTDGADLRWSFNDLRPDSFLWRGEISRDGGKTWRLQEEHRIHRRQTGAR